MFLLIEDVSERYQLKQHEHDCAFIFAGLIICISLYLFAWSLIRFTLHIPLKTSAYTLMIEGMTFLLFLEILFLTSLSMRDIGLIPKLSTLKRNFIETILIGVVALHRPAFNKGCSDTFRSSYQRLLYRRLPGMVHISICLPPSFRNF